MPPAILLTIVQGNLQTHESRIEQHKTSEVKGRQAGVAAAGGNRPPPKHGRKQPQGQGQPEDPAETRSRCQPAADGRPEKEGDQHGVTPENRDQGVLTLRAVAKKKALAEGYQQAGSQPLQGARQ